jgi:chemotaxis-related protein WspD
MPLTNAPQSLHLLDRALPDDIRREWTERVATPLRRDEQGTESALLFRLGGEWLALSTVLVHAIAPVPAIHSIPRRRDGAPLGIANIEGALVVCVALDALLGVSPPDDGAIVNSVAARMIVVSAPGGRLAFRVDEVHGVHRFHRDELRAVPATLGNAAVRHTVAMLPWRGLSAGRLDDALVLRTMHQALT